MAPYLSGPQPPALPLVAFLFPKGDSDRVAHSHHKDQDHRPNRHSGRLHPPEAAPTHPRRSSAFRPCRFQHRCPVTGKKLPRHQTPNPVGVVPFAQGIAPGSKSSRLKHCPTIPPVPTTDKPPVPRRTGSTNWFPLPPLRPSRLRGELLASRLRQNPCTPAHGSPKPKTRKPFTSCRSNASFSSAPVNRALPHPARQGKIQSFLGKPPSPGEGCLPPTLHLESSGCNSLHPVSASHPPTSVEGWPKPRLSALPLSMDGEGAGG